MKSTKESIRDRIKTLEEAILKGQEYLENGAHANWSGFQPWFVKKLRGGKPLPPHKDWVRNVFLPGRERAVREAERLLEKLPDNEVKGRR